MEKKREKKRIKVTSQIRQLSYDLKSTKKKPDERGASIRLALFLGASPKSTPKIEAAPPVKPKKPIPAGESRKKKQTQNPDCIFNGNC